MGNEDKMTLEEAVVYSKLTKRKLQQLMKADKIPFNRISAKVVFINKRDIDKITDPSYTPPKKKEEGEVILSPENQPLADEVKAETEKLRLQWQKRRQDNARAAFEQDIPLKEILKIKKKTLAGREALEVDKREFEEREEEGMVRIRELNEINVALKAKIIEKDQATVVLNDLLGGEKVAEWKLTAKGKAEAREVEKVQRKETDARDYPYLDVISSGIIVLFKCSNRMIGYGSHGILLSGFLHKWGKNLKVYATYKVVEPASDLKRDIIKAEDETEENKDVVRGNYAWAMATFKTCSEVMMRKCVIYDSYANIDKGFFQTVFGSKSSRGSDNGEAADLLADYYDNLCGLFGITDGRDNTPPVGYRVETPMMN